MPLTLLTDKDVKSILYALTISEVEELQGCMRRALHGYATTGGSTESEENQLRRTVVNLENGKTSLFMPSTSATTIGIKVVTLGQSSSTDPTVSTSTLTQNDKLQGVLTLMDTDGRPFAFLDAEELTAFRTALASTLLVSRRHKVQVIACFGCGKQAYWHTRLTLLLRGKEVEKVHFISRTFSERTESLIQAFTTYDATSKKREGWLHTTFDVLALNNDIERMLKGRIRAADVIFCTTPSTKPLFDHTILTNTEGHRRTRLIIAIGSYKPNMIEIPPQVMRQALGVTQQEGDPFSYKQAKGGVILIDTLACLKEAGELIQSKIQASRTIRLGEIVMLDEMKHENALIEDLDNGSSLIDKNSAPGYSLIKVIRRASSSSHNSDTFCTGSQKSSYMKNQEPSGSLSRSCSRASLFDNSEVKQTEKEDHMSRWLSVGNVIYKSVGMGLMDLVVGGEIIKLARKRNVGATVEGF